MKTEEVKEKVLQLKEKFKSLEGISCDDLVKEFEGSGFWISNIKQDSRGKSLVAWIYSRKLDDQIGTVLISQSGYHVSIYNEESVFYKTPAEVIKYIKGE